METECKRALQEGAGESGQDRGAPDEFYAPGCGHFKKLAPEYEKLGAGFKETNSVLIAKVDCDEHKGVCSKYGEGDHRSVQAPAEFMNNEGGTNVKISAVPSSVVGLTSGNFDEIVLDEKKDVLVEFSAPGGGHCKPLAPTYEKVATTLNQEAGMVIANLDADKYKDLAEKYGLSGYPTLKFFPKNNKAGEGYDADKDLDDFVTFIIEKSGANRDAKGQ